MTGSTTAYEQVLEDLRGQRSRIDGAIAAIEDLLGPTPAPAKMRLSPALVKQVAKPARASAQRPAKAPRKPPPPNCKRTERVAEIQRRLAAGEDVKAIASAVGVSDSAVYLHRKKMGKAPAKQGGKSPDPPRFRCSSVTGCGQVGVDPKRCDHCGELRKATA